MVEHAVRACVELAKSGGPQLNAIYVIGFFREDVFRGFTDALSAELGVRIEYLQELDEMVRACVFLLLLSVSMDVTHVVMVHDVRDRASAIDVEETEMRSIVMQ